MESWRTLATRDLNLEALWMAHREKDVDSFIRLGMPLCAHARFLAGVSAGHSDLDDFYAEGACKLWYLSKRVLPCDNLVDFKNYLLKCLINAMKAYFPKRGSASKEQVGIREVPVTFGSVCDLELHSDYWDSLTADLIECNRFVGVTGELFDYLIRCILLDVRPSNSFVKSAYRFLGSVDALYSFVKVRSRVVLDRLLERREINEGTEKARSRTAIGI